MPDNQPTAAPSLLLFEPGTGGHHGLFIKHLVDYWCKHSLPGRLAILVADDFLAVHRELAEQLADPNLDTIQVYTFTRPSSLFASLVAHDFTMGRMVKRYIERLTPTACLLMYFDHLQLSLGLDLRFSTPLRIGGIYFRPSLHYPDLTGQPGNLRDRFRNVRKTLQLRLALRNPHLHTLFCLDPYAIPSIEALKTSVRAVPLVDAIEPAGGATPNIELPVDPGRKTALLFGSLAGRKGIFTVLEALPLIAPADQDKLAVVFTGRVAKAERNRFYVALDQIRASTRVQIVIEDRFVDDRIVPALFTAVDLVLAPYQKHTGSSNVLVHAAIAGVPVLGSDYGLVGVLIRRRRLGTAIDTTRPDELARALERFARTGNIDGFDREEARRFGQENSVQRFAETIFTHMLEPSS